MAGISISMRYLPPQPCLWPKLLNGTEDAPEYWKNLDPHWGASGPPMRRYFHPDGSITADPDDKVWGGHECSYTVVTETDDDGVVSENYVRVNIWPRLAVSRREDWGWELSNFICVYSIPDADKQCGVDGSLC